MFADAPFNAIAATYDIDFTKSVIGRIQRAQIRKYLTVCLASDKQLNILEINCGTGEDALWLAEKGHTVLATDLSEQMIYEARNKLESKPGIHKVMFEVCSFDTLLEKYKGRKFDLIFSNFGGLNCIDEPALIKLNEDLNQLLLPHGKLIMVLLAKYCLMEQLYYYLKAMPAQAKRRSLTVKANLSPTVIQQTWYYSSKQLKELFKSFKLIRQKPVALFIPPSYLNSKIKHYPFLLAALNASDLLFSHLPMLSDYADHLFLYFEKRA